VGRALCFANHKVPLFTFLISSGKRCKKKLLYPQVSLLHSLRQPRPPCVPIAASGGLNYSDLPAIMADHAGNFSGSEPSFLRSEEVAAGRPRSTRPWLVALFAKGGVGYRLVDGPAREPWLTKLSSFKQIGYAGRRGSHLGTPVAGTATAGLCRGLWRRREHCAWIIVAGWPAPPSRITARLGRARSRPTAARRGGVAVVVLPGNPTSTCDSGFVRAGLRNCPNAHSRHDP